MFSQLTALAKSATDFSLDNLQEKEEDDTEVQSEAAVNSSVQASSSSHSNRQICSSPQTNPSETGKTPSASSSFTTFFKSTPQTNDESALNAPASSSMTSSFNQLLGFSSKSGSGNAYISNKQNKNLEMEGKTEQVSYDSDEAKHVKQIEAVTESSHALSTKEDEDLDMKSGTSKPAKTPPKAKKGSGREAARILEMQLRASVSDLEANLEDKNTQLDHVKRCREQEKGELEKLKAEVSNLRDTISELEESSIDMVARNEELEREVGSLQEEVREQKQLKKVLSLQNESEEHVDDKISMEQKEVVYVGESTDVEVGRLKASIVELQQSLSTQASKHKTQLKALEKKAKSKIAAASEKADVLATEVAALNAELASKVAEAEAERSAHLTTLKELKETHVSNISEVEEEKATLEQCVDQLQEEKQKLSNLLHRAEEEKSILQASLEQQLRDVVEESSGEATAKEVKLIELQDQCSDLRDQLSASENLYNQLKEKFASFTEKTKVQVMKFIETQKAADEEKQKMTATLEARESEVTSLRLKLETVDYTLSDRKALSSELAERYSELQRDMQRKIEELSSKEAFAEDLQRSLSEQRDQISTLNGRMLEKETELEEAQRRAAAEVAKLREEFASTVKSGQAKMEQQKKESAAIVDAAERRIEALLEENEALRLQVVSLQKEVDRGVGNKKTLEEYKMRAQKAVKQANTTSAAISAKLSIAEESVGFLQAQLSTAEKRIEELQSSLNESKEELEKERCERNDQVSGVETKSFELQSEVLSLKSKLDEVVLENENLKVKNDHLTAALEEHRRDVQQQEILLQMVGNRNKLTPSKVLKSSNNKTAVVVPVRRSAHATSSPAASTQNLKSDNLGKASDYYSNDSDCVLVKEGSMDYVEVDANAQSDMESGGNVSENSSVVVQWKNIMHRPNVTGTNSTNSPNSDSTDNCSPSKSSSINASGKMTTGDDHGDDDNDDIDVGRVSKVESMVSIPSCSSDNSLAGHDDSERYTSGKERGNYFFVNELKKELHRLRQEVASCHMVADDLRRNASIAEEEKSKAIQDYNELKAFHERTKRLLSSPDSATNIEYLKKCVFRLMVTKEVSERSRLYPVISTLLKFTPVETREVTAAIQDEVAATDYSIGNSASWFAASSTLGGLFKGGGAVHGTITSTGEVVSDEDRQSGASTTESNSSWW